jgi:thiamine biosynthesis lipoprotein ApbE
MRRPPPIAVPVACALLFALCPRPAGAAEEFAFYHENVMGTSLELRVRADSEAAVAWAEGRVLAEIDRLCKVLSGYDPDSELSRWLRTPGAPARVSTELFEVLQASDRWRAATAGAFDPRVEALTRLWAGSARQGRLPTVAEVTSARALMGRDAWRLDPGSRTAARLPGGPVSLDGIAKGYIVGKACDAALDRARGVRGLLLNVGGDLRARGESAATVAVVDPRHDSETSEPLTYIAVRDRSVSTSGRSQRGFRIDGRWYSHIFDPRTGLPADGVAGATVVSEVAADADALATAFNVLPVAESLALAASLPGVECLIVAADGRVSRSAGWGRYEVPPPTRLALAGAGQGAAKEGEGGKAPAKDGTWDTDYELAVTFEINRPEAEVGRYRRPYVAIWVEDKDGFPVRTLALWVSVGGSGPFQWLPDLKRWYRSDQARKLVDKTELVLTMARPTRPTGKYTVVWDGKDDHDKLVDAGEYTLFIDAAREHGTYQNMRTQLNIAGKPFAEELKGNVEIRSASIEYRRKGPGK